MNQDNRADAQAPANRVEVSTGRGDLPVLQIDTPWSTGEIYRHGATVTHFQKKGDEPLLFLSQCSRFEESKPIRGGIPICLPWFGMKEGLEGQHGFARLQSWEMEAVDQSKDGSVTVRLRLPEMESTGPFEMFAAEYVVTMSDTLTAELRVTNQSPSKPLQFEECLHTYFQVGDIARTCVLGLKGLDYLDKPSGFARKAQEDIVVEFAGEVDRVYLDAPPKLEIRDESLGRRIRIETMNAHSVVVWNPWEEKARAMEDFGDDEFRKMVCVESGNVHHNGLTLEPGATSTLTVRLSTSAL